MVLSYDSCNWQVNMGGLTVIHVIVVNMHAEAHKMDWNTVASLEGSELMALSGTEMDEVSGGVAWWVAPAIIAGAGITGFGAGVFFGWLSWQR